MNLENLKAIHPKDAKGYISNKKGIYFWYDNSLVYIGIATGASGLKGRICSQHLNPKYLEYRPEKHTKKDIYQLNYPIEKMSKTLLSDEI